MGVDPAAVTHRPARQRSGVTAADVVAAVRAHVRVTGAELVAPAPRAALADFPDDVPLRAPKALEDELLS